MRSVVEKRSEKWIVLGGGGANIGKGWENIVMEAWRGTQYGNIERGGRVKGTQYGKAEREKREQITCVQVQALRRHGRCIA